MELLIVFNLLYLFTTASGQGLTIDLGYGIYTGINNSTTSLNVWKGIRYASPPTGTLRWQAPQPPPTSRATPTLASTLGPSCPQSFSQFQGAPFYPGNEDCLYLNVYSPSTASTTNQLPVLVEIHGGGYGQGDASTDMSSFMNSNENSFLVVTIQYRLGAFGFLSSPEIKSRGVLNAGLLDQNLALKWVQQHISKFGGDPSQVTIGGESSGGGSVMLHAIALNGSLGTSLFRNIISASPFLPSQPNYNDFIPVRHYYDFATYSGCPSSGNVFDCLVSKDSLTLQYASNLISTNLPTPHGNWAFIPVTDGTYITSTPSILLSPGHLVNGINALLGNNANEGSLVVPATITTQSSLISWIKSNYPNLSDTNVTSLLSAYPSPSDPVNANDPKYETDGYGPGTAVNVSQVGTGHQQRAYNIYAESAAICPSYWLANAFTTSTKSAYHYQYSVPYAVHGSDITAYYGPPTPNQSPEFVTAFQRIYGSFITSSNPSIQNEIANGASSSSPHAANPASNWPKWTLDTSPMQINLNESGGVPYTQITAQGIPVTQFSMPGLRNNITVANAYAWEGGRGERCKFWRKLSPFVPQ